MTLQLLLSSLWLILTLHVASGLCNESVDVNVNETAYKKQILFGFLIPKTQKTEWIPNAVLYLFAFNVAYCLLGLQIYI